MSFYVRQLIIRQHMDIKNRHLCFIILFLLLTSGCGPKHDIVKTEHGPAIDLQITDNPTNTSELPLTPIPTQTHTKKSTLTSSPTHLPSTSTNTPRPTSQILDFPISTPSSSVLDAKSSKNSLKLLAQIHHPREFLSLSVTQKSMNNRQEYLVAIGTIDGDITVWNLSRATQMISENYSDDAITDLAFSSNGSRLSIIESEIEGYSCQLSIWHFDDSEQYKVVEYSEPICGPLLENPARLALAGLNIQGTHIIEYDLKTYEVNTLAMHYLPWGILDDYGPYDYLDNGHLVTWGLNQSSMDYYFIDTFSNQRIELPFHPVFDTNLIETSAISPNGKYFATGHSNGSIYIWDLSTQSLAKKISGHPTQFGDGWLGALRHLSFGAQSDLLVSVGWDNTSRLWDLTTGAEIRRFETCCFANFSPDKRYLITGNQESGLIRVWGIEP